MTFGLSDCLVKKKNYILNMDPEVVLKTIKFLHNLLMGQNKLVLLYTRLERHARGKHSSLLGTFLSYEGNEVL